MLANTIEEAFTHKGYYSQSGDYDVVLYRRWYQMINRCYNPYLLNTIHKGYRNTTVCEEWFDYCVFAKWFTENVPKYPDGTWIEDYQLDKDIISTGTGKSCYSPQTCMFVERSENMQAKSNNPRKSNNTLSVDSDAKYVSVTWHKRTGKWMVRSKDRETGKVSYHGYYLDKDEATKVMESL